MLSHCLHTSVLELEQSPSNPQPFAASICLLLRSALPYPPARMFYEATDPCCCGGAAARRGAAIAGGAARPVGTVSSGCDVGEGSAGSHMRGAATGIKVLHACSSLSTLESTR